MNQQLSNIELLIQQSALTDEEKQKLLKEISNADNQWNILEFKLDQTEKVKKTTSVLLEETIEELEKKRKDVEAQNKELEIQNALERVRAVALSMKEPADMLEICKTISQQLQLLNVKEIRNVQTAIFYEGKGTYMNYEYYAKHDKTFTTETTYTNNEIHNAFANQMLKGNGEFFITHIKGDEVKDWIAYQKTTNVFIDDYLNIASSLNYYWFSLGAVALGISTYEPLKEEEINLFKRFLKVFELSYTRYLDIEQAIAQAREAKIEAALERVRARTMAMQKSDELADTAAILFSQFKNLGYEPDRITIGIMQEEKHILDLWATSGDAGEPRQFYQLPFNEPHVLAKCVKAWKEQKRSLVLDLYGQPLKEYTKFWKSFGATQDTRRTIDQVVFNFAFFSKGYLGFISFEHVPPLTIELLERFAGVFDLTYTRFLDLQKAEAQAKEAQIEAALEKVRSRSLAVYKSDEFNEVIKVVFEKLQELGIPMTSASINVFIDGSKDTDAYICGSGEDGLTLSHIRLIYFDHPIANDRYDAHKRGIDFFTKTYSAEEKNSFYEHAFAVTDLKHIPDDIKKMVMESERYTISIALNKNSMIVINDFEGKLLSEKNIEIVKRFSRVFEQAYIRFLDLQKSEAQTRESEIELGLERVRSRAMAMQTSEELNALIGTVFTELTKLDLVLTRCVILIYEGNEKGVRWWMANSETPSTPMNFFVKYADMPFFNEYLKGWYNRELKWQYCLEDKNKIKTDNFLFNETELSLLPDFVIEGMKAPDRVYLNASFNNFGNLTLATLEPLSEEHFNILLRFAKVFDLTYTRFNDLKQAEAQAREAQVQLALERVRARTMAMQKSDELSDAVYVLFQQFKELGENPDQATIGVINEEEKVIEYWVTMYAQPINKVFKFSIDEPNVTNKIYKAWKENKKSLVIDLSGNALTEFMTYRAGKGGAAVNSNEKRRIINVAFFSKGLLNVQSNEERSQESVKLLERFASVFEQTYTRFLDLQKAESQAREAQVQLALERVRARTMAMQKQNDLLGVLDLLVEQLVKLGVNLQVANFSNGIPGGDWDLWIEVAADDGTIFNNYVHFPRIDHPYFHHVEKNIETFRKDGTDLFKDVFSKEEKDSWQDYINTQTIYKDLTSEEHKQSMYEKPGYAWSMVILKDTWVSICRFNTIPFSDEEDALLKRFANAFGQTYTRFLDLQKAEAQAREAQIEAALERVRSRSMAMHKSDELKEVIRLVLEQFVHLSINAEHAGFYIDYNIHDDMHIWLADPNIEPFFAIIPYFDTPTWNSFLEAKAKGTTFYTDLLNFEEKNKFYQSLFKLFTIPEEAKAFYMQCKGLAVSTVLLDNVGLYIENFSAIPYTDAENKILMRFGKVFQQTYTRFLDLQKAEAQARESQIQLALERARAQSMMMQHSTELDDTLRVFHEQVLQLNIPSAFSFLWLPDEEKDRHIFWAAWAENNSFKSKAINYPLDRNEPATAQCLIDWKSNEPVVAYHVLPEGVENYFAAWNELIAGVEQLKPEYFRDGLYYVEAFIKYGCFGVMVKNSLAEDEKKILERFATEFERAYTRFLDLQKAEAQTRESQIQLALERVRARTMAMQKSDELTEAALLLFEQLQSLGTVLWSCGFNIWGKEETGCTSFIARGGKMLPPVKLSFTENPTLWRFYESKQKGEEFWFIELSGEDCKSIFGYVAKQRQAQTGDNVFLSEVTLPSSQITHLVNFSHGNLMFITLEPHPELHDIFKRFGKVFEQTYTRFLDLQKAEAQAREAQIEASLERVRSKTMAMHNSAEVGETVTTMFDELLKLGIETLRCGIGIMQHDNKMEVWTAKSETSGKVDLVIGRLDMNMHSLLQGAYHNWKNNKDSFSYELKGKDLINYFTAINNYPDYPIKYEISSLPLKIFHNDFYFAEGSLFVFSIKELPPESKKILKRFASVFGQTYKRYLDLQNAETQAREAQIEAALERVRARTMAMQKSDELSEAAALLFQQFKDLGEDPMQITIGTINEAEGMVEMRPTDWSGSGLQVNRMFNLSITEPTLMNKLYKAWKERTDFVIVDLAGKELKEWIRYRNSFYEIPVRAEDVTGERVVSSAFFSRGFICISTLKQPEQLTIELLKRFAGVFDLTYTRFLDLQKAEAQAREATIEAALERVRGRAMAMHNSNDLSSTASIVFTELRKLGINPIRCGVGLLSKESRKAQLYSATSSADEDNLALIGWVELSGHPVLKNIYDTWIKNEEYFPELSGKQLKLYYELLLKGLSVKAPEQQRGQKQYGTFLPFTIGCLYAWSEAPYNEADIKILKRFANIIDLTFRRYIDLQKSETSAKEAIKQAALDRIRADIASMRTTKDLERITPLIWNELNILSVPFVRCGVFIMNDEQQRIHTFLSTPDGKAIAAFHIPYHTPGNIKHVISHWRNNKNYIDHWDEDAFTEFANMLVTQGALTSSEQYLQTIPHGGFYLHFLPFLQGMLYVGNTTKLSDDEINLIQSIADAFSTAYARYEDFNKLEAAKKQVDRTLIELKQTQQQLVQSEKMASLGELTAGIAHEIQNPLNFVNNFSEVSDELLDEAKEELATGNLQLATEIIDDIKQNLEKINHHGKRADAIVKNMLQHSRKSSGQKEPTDINALCDEYLRLSFHGMRAKDKSFNADFKTEFDERIGKINIVPQDIGRVLLNLFNNAFYAVNEKRKNLSGLKDLTGLVIVQTKKLNDAVEIKISDNGNGIPQNIIDKIFQPFFTTKPTGQGTGLGLSLAYDIITKEHNGAIKVESKEGEGSAFIIQLLTIPQ